MIVAGFCANLQSAAAKKLQSITVKKNKKVVQICDILFDLGYIAGYSVLTPQRLIIRLKYTAGRGPLRSLVLFSRPSSRVYYSYKNLLGKGVNNYYRTNSFTIFYTATGKLMTDIECFMYRIGGEPLCVIS